MAAGAIYLQPAAVIHGRRQLRQLALRGRAAVDELHGLVLPGPLQTVLGDVRARAFGALRTAEHS